MNFQPSRSARTAGKITLYPYAGGPYRGHRRREGVSVDGMAFVIRHRKADE